MIGGGVKGNPDSFFLIALLTFTSPSGGRLTTRARGQRRGPVWLRETASPALHAILARFDRDRTTADLSDAQEWLYDRAVEELEYRRRTARPIWTCCSCRYCVPPF